MPVGLEDLTGQSSLVRGSDLPLSSNLMGERASLYLVSDETGRGLDKTIRKGCMLVLDGQGVRVRKGTRGGEPPTLML